MHIPQTLMRGEDQAHGCNDKMWSWCFIATLAHCTSKTKALNNVIKVLSILKPLNFVGDISEAVIKLSTERQIKTRQQQLDSSCPVAGWAVLAASSQLVWWLQWLLASFSCCVRVIQCPPLPWLVSTQHWLHLTNVFPPSSSVPRSLAGF